MNKNCLNWIGPALFVIALWIVINVSTDRPIAEANQNSPKEREIYQFGARCAATGVPAEANPYLFREGYEAGFGRVWLEGWIDSTVAAQKKQGGKN
ncbi:MAG: hypothetical protein ACKVX7_00640 [Planctomycetota bacterium]